MKTFFYALILAGLSTQAFASSPNYRVQTGPGTKYAYRCVAVESGKANYEYAGFGPDEDSAAWSAVNHCESSNSSDDGEHVSCEVVDCAPFGG